MSTTLLRVTKYEEHSGGVSGRGVTGEVEVMQ